MPSAAPPPEAARWPLRAGQACVAHGQRVPARVWPVNGSRGMIGPMPARTRQSDVVFAPIMRAAAMKKLDETIRAVAPKEVVVTLIGESGTGKEIFARRVHELSHRRRGPFIPINCAAIPEALFESELFGHERGAFTGANERARGKVEAASEGTLFLDEIGEMPMPMQAKLLRFLENRRFMRVGGSTKIEANVRLVFATLRPLEEEVRAGRFRADLFYRIQGITLNMPPLRERKADIPLLVTQFVAQLSAKHATEPPRLTRRALSALVSHTWPGNVRELRNVIEVLCLLRPGKIVRLRDLPALVQGSRESRGELATTLTLDLSQSLEAMIERIFEAVIAAEGGNRTHAAQRLGVSVRTLQRHATQASKKRVTHAGRRTKKS
jgi:transcriptional regulator with PAS, ATPase and Fis domain